MQDLYDYGTVTAAFTVYEDFLSYTSCVYVHVIKIFGYGVEDDTEYWYYANSWNDSCKDSLKSKKVMTVLYVE